MLTVNRTNLPTENNLSIGKGLYKVEAVKTEEQGSIEVRENVIQTY